MPIDSATRSCGHTIFRHLFYNIRCPQQPLAHKVTFIASAILIISGLAWKGWSSYQHSQTPAKKPFRFPPQQPHQENSDVSNNHSNLSPQPQPGQVKDVSNHHPNSVVSMPEPAKTPEASLPWQDYPAEGNAAIAFANEKLQESGPGLNVQNTDFSTLRPHFFKLMNDYGAQIEKYIYIEVDVMKSGVDWSATAQGCWSDPKLLKLMVEYMQITYAFSCLSLADLNRSYENMEERVAILTGQETNHYKDWFTCPKAYHMARGAEIHAQLQSAKVRPNFKIPEAHKDSFYQESTPQSLCRTLYNDYCDRVRMHLNMTGVNKSDGRYNSWVQKDIQEKVFRLNPGTIPT